MLDRAKSRLLNQIFRVGLQERLGRQRFFHDAFRALSFNGIDGDYAEFGCCGGRTFALAYAEAKRNHHDAELWAFDSFEGLPGQAVEQDEHPVWQKGSLFMSEADFRSACTARGIPQNRYHVVPGFYEQTLPKLGLDGGPRNVALAYIDCDMYSSTVTVLNFLYPRLKHGMIIAFDDYFCYSATQVSGERRAMLEIFASDPRWELLPYVQFGWHGQSFIVEDRRILALGGGLGRDL